MQISKIIFAAIFAFTGSFAFGEGQAVAPLKPVPVPKIWTQIVCENGTKSVCLAANGLAWIHSADFYIDPAVKVATAGMITWMVAIGVRSVIGETPQIVSVLTVANAARQIGTMFVIAGAAVIVIGTLGSTLQFLLMSTSKTAPPEQDEEMVRQCAPVLAPFQGADRIEKLQALTPDEMTELLKCLPQDKNLGPFLSQLGAQKQELENQIHAN